MKAVQGVAFALGLVGSSTHVLAASITPRQLYPTCAFFGYSIKDSFAATDAGTYVGCSAACLSYPQCKSFAFDTQGHKDCQLYDVYVDDNINLLYGSPYYFYDIGCETQHTCGELGDTYRWEPFDYSTDSSLTEQKCIDKCVSLSNCKSYAYGNNECFIYDTIVQGNIKPRETSPYRFFDRACISAASASTTSVTKSSTSATIVKTSTSSSVAGKGPATSSAARTSSTTMKTPAPNTTTSKTPSLKGSLTTTSSSTRASSTSAKILSTSLTISNQAYFCTAVN